MTFAIRQATLDDLDFLCTLRLEVLRAVFNIPESKDLSDLAQANASYYSLALANGTHVACLLYDGESFVACGGFCLQTELPSPDNPNGRCAFLMNIYTRPQFRDQGAGALVVNWLIRQAQKQDVTKIYLETSKEARPLYTHNGFVDMHDYLILVDNHAKSFQSGV